MKQFGFRILAVSPRFAPINGADTHRLRLLLNHAASAGWAVEVLAVDSTNVVGPVDEWLSERLPREVPVHRVKAWRPKGWGTHGLAQRCMIPLYRKGCALLASGRFDLVFFSTTEFAVHVLGPLWRWRYGIPFCMDYQDPWVSDYYQKHPHIIPPGGRLKYTLADRVHRLLERFTVRACSGFLSVSQAYPVDLIRRYGKAVAGKPILIRSFPAEPEEIASLGRMLEITKSNGIPGSWRYVGRGGADMARAASAFFQAWTMAEHDGVVQAGILRFEAFGTSYAPTGQGEQTFMPLVVGTSLADKVSEIPDRLGYKDMLCTLLSSNALIVFGSDDPGYSASKIYPYLLAGKPLLAIFHRASSVVELIEQVGGGVCVTFDDETSANQLAMSIKQAWFDDHRFASTVPLDRDAFKPYTAQAQAADIASWMQAILAQEETS